jgi:hypothetical protein
MSQFTDKRLDALTKKVATEFGTKTIGVIAAYVMNLHHGRNGGVVAEGMRLDAGGPDSINSRVFKIGDLIAERAKVAYGDNANESVAFAALQTWIKQEKGDQSMFDTWLPRLLNQPTKAEKEATAKLEADTRVAKAVAAKVKGDEKAEDLERLKAEAERADKRSQAVTKQIATLGKWAGGADLADIPAAVYALLERLETAKASALLSEIGRDVERRLEALAKAGADTLVPAQQAA